MNLFRLSEIFKERFLEILPGIVLFLPGIVAAAESCDFLSAWQDAERSKPIHAKTIRETSDWMRAVSIGIQAATEKVYEGYRQETITDGQLDSCLRSTGLDRATAYSDFRNAIPATFFQRSLQDLGKIRGLTTERFSRTLSEKYESGNLILFRLIGHYANVASPSGEKAGFHRGHHSIFMDFSKVPANEWLLIFAHEHAHSLDVTLSDAMPIFADEALRTKIAALSKKTNLPTELSTEDLQDLDRWLIAGLDRGFLAEVRAWAVSFEIYQEGIRDGAWKSIAWMENMLSDRKAGESAMRFAIRYLSPRFTDPVGTSYEADLFGRPLVATRLKQLRKKVDSGAITVNPIL